MKSDCDSLFFFTMLTCFFLSPVFFAVTLLDSMSALADLGWEAYPNEGVSTCSTTPTHNANPHLFLLDLAPKV